MKDRHIAKLASFLFVVMFFAYLYRIQIWAENDVQIQLASSGVPASSLELTREVFSSMTQHLTLI